MECECWICVGFQISIYMSDFLQKSVKGVTLVLTCPNSHCNGYALTKVALPAVSLHLVSLCLCCMRSYVYAIIIDIKTT